MSERFSPQVERQGLNDGAFKYLQGIAPQRSLKEALQLNQSVDSGVGYVSAHHNSRGEIVKFWQTQMYFWAINQPELRDKYKDFIVTDSFSSNPLFTELIKDFQRAHGLEVDGIIGPRTFRAFLTRYYFSNEGLNLGSQAFEAEFFALLSQEEYLKVISGRRRALSQLYGLEEKVPVTAEEILQDPAKFAAFEGLFLYYSKGKAPISARRFLELCAQYDFDPTLALAQAVQESHIGTQGAAVATNNIFNVGNTDDGSRRYFPSAEAGLVAYLELMTNRYASSAFEFIARDGRNVNGNRYASDPNYTQRIYDLVLEIRMKVKPESIFRKEDIPQLPRLAMGQTLEILGVKFVIPTPQDLPLMNPLLFYEVASAAKEAGISVVNISCLITGHRYYTKAGYPSRHNWGLALDINMLDGYHVTSAEGQRKAWRLVAALERLGYIKNRESGNVRAVLFQNDFDHFNHIHISNLERGEAELAQREFASRYLRAA